LNSTNIFSATFFAAAKLCVFSFVFVNLPFSVKAQSADLPTQANNQLIDILANKQHATHKKRQSLEQLTLTLAKQIKQLKNKKNSNNSTQVNDLIETAKSRQILIAELLKLSPSAVKRSKLPSNISKHAPDEIKQYLLQKKELAGELEIFYEDYEQVELSRLRHVLKTKTGRVELHFSNIKSLSNLKHGTKIKAKGLFTENSHSEGSKSASALIESQAEIVLLEDGGTSTFVEGDPLTQLENTLGEQKTLVLLINFQDNPTERPWTTEEVQTMVFGTVNDYYQEASYGQTWLTGDVMGYYTLPIDAVCDSTLITSFAEQMLLDNGIDSSKYKRLLYVFPKIDNCGWSGKGTVGGEQSKAWINGSLNLRTIGHELGHNLGLYHAKKLECGENVLSGECYAIEYGDSLDIMGASGVTGHFNAFNKEQLQWLTSDSLSTLPQINTVDSNGTFLIEPYENSTEQSLKAVKIARGLDSSSGEKLWYYLEYRQALGFDAYLSSYPTITSGILFHLASGGYLNSSQLIDMTPASASADWNDSVLSVGASYTDTEAGITITTDWSDETGASISVYFDEICVNRSPQISIVASEETWLEPGAAAIYTVNISNVDSQSCESSNFELSVVLPENWSASTENVSLMPNESAAVDLTITSSVQADDDFYNFEVAVSNSDFPSINNVDSLSYVVSSPETVCINATPSIALISYQNLTNIAAGAINYTLNVTNLDSSECSASEFSIFADIADGWSTTSETVNLLPLESAIVDVVITQVETATAGSYNFTINALNQSIPEYSGVGSVTYLVEEGAACNALAPLIELFSQAATIVAGEDAIYQFTITNPDSAACAEAEYSISSLVPEGWSSSSAQVTLLSTESAIVDIVISASEDSAAANYSLSFAATNVADVSVQSTLSIDVSVKQVINTAPNSVNDVIAISSKQLVEINVLANDTDAENDDLTIISVTQGAKGRVTISSSGTIFYSPAKRFKRSDLFSYTISDGNKESTATVTISLVSSDGSNGSNNKGRKR